jgi:hypothetical protein
MFLDQPGPERAKMLRNLCTHANQVFEHGKRLGIDGPVFQIGWNRQQKVKDSGRGHVHRDAVSIQLNWGTESWAEWVPLTGISELQPLGGDYDWIVRPKIMGQYDYLMFLEEKRWKAQNGA